MRFLLSTAILSLFLPLTLVAQQSFQNTYGETGAQNREQGYQVVTKGDNYLLFGSSNSYSEEFQMFLLEVDANGNEVSSKTFGLGNDTNEGFALCEAVDGGYVLLGRTTNLDGDLILRSLKIDEDGNEVWSKLYSEGQAVPGWNILPNNDGYIITGTSLNNQLLVCKLDLEGGVVWSKSHGVYSRGYNSIALSDGNIASVGVTAIADDSGALTHFEQFVIKMDQEGNVIWEAKERYDGAFYSRGFDIIEEDNGDLILIGSRSDENDENYRMVLSRFSSEGLLTNYKVIENEGNNNANYVVESTKDGGFIFIGNVSSDGTSDSRQGYLLKTNGDFDTQWEKYYGAEMGSSTLLLSGLMTEDGGFAVLGGINFEGSNDFYFIKTDAEGNITGESTGIQIVQNSGMNLFPNPAETQVTIEFENEMNGVIQIELMDVNGRVVKSLEDYKRISSFRRVLDIKDVPSGLYLVSVADGHTAEIRKLLIH